jgi:hypothetical protein
MHVRRRIHACPCVAQAYVRARALSCEEEDTCMCHCFRVDQTCLMRRRIHACDMRRRIQACHVKHYSWV